MKITRIHLHGFGPYREPLDLDLNGGFTCLTGETGAGKTTILEALLLALYGETSWYAGQSIYSRLTEGETEGVVEVEFDCAGHLYTAKRRAKITEKGQHQQAWLHRDGEQIAGPKVGDVETVAERIIGSREFVLATMVQGQNSIGDLCFGTPPRNKTIDAHRREILAGILGVDHLSALSDRFLARAKSNADRAEVLEAQLVPPGALEAEKTAKELALVSARDGLGTTETQLADARARAETLRADLQRAEQGKAELVAVVNAHNQDKSHAVRLQRVLADTRQIESDLQAKIDRKNETERKVSALNKAVTQRTELEKQEAKYRSLREWKMREATFGERLYAAEVSVKVAEENGNISADELDLAKNLPALENEYRRKRTEVVRIEQDNRLRNEKIARLKETRASINAELASAKERLSAKPETPADQDVCLVCPLFKEFATLPNIVSRLGMDLASVEEKISELVSAPERELEDLTNLILALRHSRGAALLIEQAPEHQKEIERARAEYDRARRDLDDHRRVAPDIVDDPTLELRRVRQIVDELQGASGQMNQIFEAERNILKVKTRAVEILNEFNNIQTKIQEGADSAERAQKTLDDSERANAEARRTLAAVEDDIATYETEAGQRRQAIGRLEAEIEGLTRRIDENETRRSDVERLREREKANRTLRLCFGPKGVQPLIIDQVAPEIEAVADEVFNHASGGAMRLRIATQGRDSTGAPVERFQILVSDERRGRGFADIAEYSGGERRTIQAVFRIALLLYCQQVTGRDLACLILDEPFDGQSDEWRRALLEAIRVYAPQFHQFLIVSHDAQIAAQADNRIHLEATYAGARVSTGDLAHV